MSDLTLFSDSFSISPYAMSAYVALEEKGLPYTLKHVGLHTRDHLREEYRALTGRVPSIAHGDFVLSESSAIAEYLEDAFPPPAYPPLFPADVKARATAREVMAWVRSDMMPIREERPTTSVFITHVDRPLSEHARSSVRRLVSGCLRLLADGREHLFGQWSLADTDLALMLQRLNLNGDELPPVLKAYAERQWGRPSVQRWLQQPRDAYTPY